MWRVTQSGNFSSPLESGVTLHWSSIRTDVWSLLVLSQGLWEPSYFLRRFILYLRELVGGSRLQTAL